MRVLYTNPYRDAIVSSYVDAHLRKGDNNHCWMKASRCLSTPSEPPLEAIVLAL